MRLHHVQVAIPGRGEDLARRFYVEGLGLVEVDKPALLQARGGLWVRSPDGAEIHLGVEEPFRPARKAHPALLLEDVASVDGAAERLTELGFEVDQHRARHLPRPSAPPHLRRPREPGGAAGSAGIVSARVDVGPTWPPST